jgi:pimeloyl-ACP methyl ester carboxylesterase
MNARWLVQDAVELLRQLGIHRADFMGYSMGGGIALALALEHPELVGKLVLVSSGFHSDGYAPDFLEAVKNLMTIENAHMDRAKKDFLRVGARPEQWPRALSRVREMLGERTGLEPDQLRHVRAETLVISGQYGVFRPEHTKQLAELLPNAKLELLPGDDHDPKVLLHSAQLASGFFDPASGHRASLVTGVPCQAALDRASSLV